MRDAASDPLSRVLADHDVAPEQHGAVRQVLARCAGYAPKAMLPALRAFACWASDADAELLQPAWWGGLPVTSSDAATIASLAGVEHLSGGANERALDLLGRYRGTGPLGWRVRTAVAWHFERQALAAALSEVTR